MTTLDDEIRALRERVAELEASEADRERAERVQNAALPDRRDGERRPGHAGRSTPRCTRIVGELMYADNFYIALYDDERQMINFPYYVDDGSRTGPTRTSGSRSAAGDARGTTAYLLRTGRPLLLSSADWRRLAARGEIDMVGEEAVSWLGVPLQSEGRTLGALVVQSYREDVRHTEADKELLTFVGRHIARRSSARGDRRDAAAQRGALR